MEWVDPVTASWYHALARLLRVTRAVPPSGLVDAINQALQPLGAEVSIYLVDREQEALRALPRTGAPPSEPMPVDTTLAGRAYTMIDPVAPPGRTDQVWTPLLDDSERLGVLEVHLPDGVSADDPAVREGINLVTIMISHLLNGKSAYGDVIRQARRSQHMSTEGEMLWRSLPPLTCISYGAAVAAVLEPAYDVGGDAFDYAFDHDTVRVAVFDAAGHGLSAALTSTLTLAATRAARAAGLDLTATAAAADQAIAGQFGELRYTTAVLAELDTSTGTVRYVNAGHPPAVLIRGGKVVTALDATPRTPLGIPQPAAVAHHQLQPGDRLLFYTDGITDARDADGVFLGLDRLVQMAEQHTATGLTVAEVCRRLARAVLHYQNGRLTDDATLMLLEWLPPASGLP